MFPLANRAKIIPALALALACLFDPGQADAARRHKPRRKNNRIVVNFQDGLSGAERQALAAELGLRVVADLDSVGITILEAAGGVTHPASARLRANPRIEAIEDDEVIDWLEMDGAAGFSGVSFPGLGEVMERLPRYRPAPASSQGELPWGIERVNAPAAWKAGARGMGSGVRVAVIDTGVDCSHPDIACDPAGGFNAAEPGSPAADDHGHGTHVAGTIAARLDRAGVAGVAPKATVIPVKVLAKDGSGSTADVVRGIVWAAEHGADVINMSLGDSEGSKSLERAIKKAISKGVVIVAAAGNEGPGDDTVAYPAAYPEVIAVAASDSRDGVASFSSRGPQVDFIAPGVNILSAVLGGKYAKYSGTSMACPHVAGLAALAVAQGAAGPEGARRALKAAAARLCPGGSCHSAKEQGAGLVDAGRLAPGSKHRGGRTSRR